MRRASLIVLVLALAAVLAPGALAGPAVRVDRNRDAGGPTATGVRADRVATQLLTRLRGDARSLSAPERRAARAAARGQLCAIGVLPGPASSFNIRMSVANVVPDPVDVGIVDSFRALGGRSLLHESVFDVVPPAGGTADVLYPAGQPGRGPIVMEFSGFDQFESVVFSTDPDTYDNPNFGATVQDLDGTVIELAYEGDRRCAGTLRFDPAFDASLAFITQTSPTP
jgi:hypothetical protein